MVLELGLVTDQVARQALLSLLCACHTVHKARRINATTTHHEHRVGQGIFQIIGIMQISSQREDRGDDGISYYLTFS
ncbi:MAG: hypothetical protein ACMUIP_10590 [bacterium]